MIAEILSVGTELLMGQIANTDAQFISRQLSHLGINIYHQTTVGDNPARVKEALALALSRADIVITTGGLGPTEDDLTKEMVAEYFGLKMVRDPKSYDHLVEMLTAHGRQMAENNLKQADFPEGAIIMENLRGTAPGCIVEQGGKAVAVLPGPPFELTDMFERQLKPYLAKKSGVHLTSRFLRIFGVGESNVETILKDLFHGTNPTLALYCGAGEVQARLTAMTEDGNDAHLLLDPLEAEIRRRLGDSVYAEGLHTSMAETVYRLLKQRGARVSFAESCTGGMLTAKIVDLPGASDVLDESHVTYANAAKQRILGVQPATLERFGAVSPECAREMAEGARRISGADYGVSVTGIAGPDGGTAEKPVGLVYIGVSDENGTIAREFRFRGNREWVRTLACGNALNLLRLRMLNLA